MSIPLWELVDGVSTFDFLGTDVTVLPDITAANAAGWKVADPKNASGHLVASITGAYYLIRGGLVNIGLVNHGLVRSMGYHGDFALGATVDFNFNTVDQALAPKTLAGTPVLSCYKANGTTESTAGITLTVDFDGRTGLHHVRVVLSDAFYVAGDYDVVITTGTVDGISVVGQVAGSFSIENRSVKAGSQMALSPSAVTSLVAAIEVELVNDATGQDLRQKIVDKINENLPDLDELTIDAIANAVMAKILDRQLAGNHEVAGSPGKLLQNLSGHVPQTGDSFARIGLAGVGLTNLGDTRIANLNVPVDTRLAADDFVEAPTAEEIADEVEARFASHPITIESPIAEDGTLTIYQGDDYRGDRAIKITIVDYAGPAVGTLTAMKLGIMQLSQYNATGGTYALVALGSAEMVGDDAVFTFELVAAQTSSLDVSPPSDPYNYVYQLRTEDASHYKATYELGAATVKKTPLG